MNERQKVFADEYIISLNATDAARKAGYSQKYIDTNASKLLENTRIKEYIQERLKEKASDRIAEAEEVLSYLTKVMRGETVEEVVIVEGVGVGLSEARKVDKIPSEKDRLKAAELLGKRYRLFVDKQEVSGSVAVVFEGEEDIEE